MGNKTCMFQNELNELLEKVKLRSTIGWTKGLINNYIIFNGGKYFD